MSESTFDDLVTEAQRARVMEVRRALLGLHKLLLESERAAYEQRHGRVTSGQLLQLLIGDERFEWLRRMSELVVLIDETFDTQVMVTAKEAEAMLSQARRLLAPADMDDPFITKYHAALQRESNEMLARAEALRLVITGGPGA